MPGVVGAMVVGALVVAGVLPPSIVLYAALLGGCALMHVFGHGGHGGGGHAGHWGGHAAHGDMATGDAEDLRQPSPGTQPEQSVSTAGLEDRAASTPTTDENTDHDHHGPRSCH
ncbi:MAG: hypothetical protein A2V85_14675 [Chloroflexi bacterium RBG_16_72_14]|nr:MAG: hypothetical protein A2V85_14675 [Chloroflexi bacterium RBG_16_72_14]